MEKDNKKIIAELSRRNPYQFDRKKKQGFDEAVSVLKKILEESNVDELEVNRHFFWSAYGLSSRHINEYQLRITHEEYGGFFDWYHTTGTLLAYHQGTQKNILKSKDAEEVAITITRYVNKKD